MNVEPRVACYAKGAQNHRERHERTASKNKRWEETSILSPASAPIFLRLRAIFYYLTCFRLRDSGERNFKMRSGRGIENSERNEERTVR